MIGGALAVLGCQLHKNPTSKISTAPSLEVDPSLSNKAASNPNAEVISLMETRDSSKLVVVDLDRRSCHTEWLLLKKARFYLNVTSAFGVQRATFDTISSAGSGGVLSTIAAIDGMKMQLPPLEGINDIIAKACTAWGQTSIPTVAVTTEFHDQVQDWLRHMGPDCSRFELGLEGWNCVLPSIDPSLAKQELVGIRSTMIRRWTRRPYLLARRIAVAKKLSDALTSVNFEREMGVLCRILSHSLAVELPATLSSLRWQNAACNLDAQFRRQAANIGLAKTMGEIHFLRQLFERTSRIGYLTIRIPRDDAPSRNLWVTLYPDDANNRHMIEETKALWSTRHGGQSKANKDSPPEGAAPTAPQSLADAAPRSCWHPLFAENMGLLNLARYLDLAGDTESVTCMDKPSDGKSVAPNMINPEQYLADSIASETEFVVTNGRAKMLRLPKGKYLYKIQSLPSDPDQWDDAASSGPETTGEISWDTRRPRPQIRHW